jgi:hypothetical protein
MVAEVKEIRVTHDIPPIGPNTVFPRRTCSVSARDQAHVHAHSGFDVDETHADPVLLATRAFGAIGDAVTTHHADVTPVITNQVIGVTALGPIGVETQVEGRVTHHEATPRGDVFAARFSIRDGDGLELAELRATLLLIDPTKPAPPRKPAGPLAGQTASPERSADALLGAFTFSPDATRAFDLELGGKTFHSSMELANSAGFPKPIVAGNQVFDILWNRYVKHAFETPVTLDFTLRRPIFWDDEIRFVQSGDETIDVMSAAGKLAMSCKIEGVRRELAGRQRPD